MEIIIDRIKVIKLLRKLSALNNPTSIDILNVLMKQEMCVTEIVSAVNKSKQNVSYQLGVLKKAGFVLSDKKGRNVYYRPAMDRLINIEDIITHA